MFVILTICRFVGMVARRLGQPQVVGQMVAGVIMGPSLFGLLFPSWQQVVFPTDSLKLLYVQAKFGVGLYMFLVGTEFETELFQSRARSAVSVSVAGMLAPFHSGRSFGVLAMEGSRSWCSGGKDFGLYAEPIAAKLTLLLRLDLVPSAEDEWVE
jgi:Kef-type K+ transport system membrane component KefB